MSDYLNLVALSKRAQMIEGISALLGWDQETYMPPKAAPVRAEQKKLLAELSHELHTGKEFEKALSGCINLENGRFLVPDLSEDQKACLRVWRRDFLRQKKLPSSFVQEFASTSSKAMFVWEEAKNGNSFQLFLPYFEELLDLIRKKIDLLGYEEHPYDALLDEFEPGATTTLVDNLFKQLQLALPRLFAEIIARQKNYPELDISPPLPLHEQKMILHALLNDIGFDFQRGRLDRSAHPFSEAYHPDDSRITCRKEPTCICDEILTTLHEAGHSFYEMGLPKEHVGTPLGQAISLGIHESVSRWWETRIGRSLPFWKFFYPKLQDRVHGELSGISLEQFVRTLNRVKPSLIRTESDEISYSLHVILRFQIEKELIEGKLQPKDLPERWNSGMKELLGVEPASNKKGCLQDVHWSMGAFGYFPTYTLGNLFSAQFFEVFSHHHPDWGKLVENGQFDFIRNWQQKEIFRHGRRYTSFELVEKVSGKKLSCEPYISYLFEKYNNL